MKKLLKRWLGITQLENEIDKMFVDKYAGLKTVVDDFPETAKFAGLVNDAEEYTYGVTLPAEDKPIVKGYNATVGRTNRR